MRRESTRLFSLCVSVFICGSYSLPAFFLHLSHSLRIFLPSCLFLPSIGPGRQLTPPGTTDILNGTKFL